MCIFMYIIIRAHIDTSISNFWLLLFCSSVVPSLLPPHTIDVQCSCCCCSSSSSPHPNPGRFPRHATTVRA